MATEAQKKARNKYNREKLMNKTIGFNRETEADLIEWIQKQDGFATYIKSLIRADMEAQKKNQGN